MSPEDRAFLDAHGGIPARTDQELAALRDASDRLTAAWVEMEDLFTRSGWGTLEIATWAATPSSFLNGGRPVDVIETDPERVLELARSAIHS